MKNIADSAKSLARNPLGIIALFIVMIYGFASLVLTVGGSSLQTTSERLPIIWFLTLFPVAVLLVFAWLVAYHHKNLYSPGDYTQDESFLKTVGIGIVPPKEIQSDELRIATSDKDAESFIIDNNALLEDEYKNIVQADICLLHATEILRERTKPGSGRYRIRVWIEAIVGESIDEVESVTYRVWADFNKKTFTSKSKESQFDLWMNVYGEFPVMALVRFANGKSVVLQRYLDIPGRPPD